MKIKIIVLIAFALLANSAAYATGDFALSLTSTGLTVYGDKTTTATATSPLIGKSSTGVGVGMKSSTTGYNVVTQHKNGTKVIGSSYDSTAIYYKDLTAGIVDTTQLGTGSETFASGWTTM